MANVYRVGSSGDVHAAIVSGDPDDPARPNACNLDGPFAGDWTDVLPPGSHCYRCFAAVGDEHGAAPVVPRRRRPGRKTVGAGGAGILATALIAWASQGGPVNVAATASPGMTDTAVWPSATPNIVWPTLLPTPSLPVPTTGPVASPAPVPSPLVRVIERVIVVEPGPGDSPRSAPTPPPCLHPGQHYGAHNCPVGQNR